MNYFSIQIDNDDLMVKLKKEYNYENVDNLGLQRRVHT